MNNQPSPSQHHDPSSASFLTPEQWESVAAHLIYVQYRAKLYQHSDREYIAVDALIDAVATHRTELPGRKAVSMKSWIRRRLHYALLSAIAEVQVSKVSQAYVKFLDVFGRPPTFEELRRFSGLAPAKVRRAWPGVVAALNLELQPDDVHTGGWLPAWAIPSSISTVPGGEEDAMPQEHCAAVWSMVATLDARDSFLLTLKYGYDYEDVKIHEIIQRAQILVDLGHEAKALSARMLIPELPPDAPISWAPELLDLETLAGVRIAIFRARKKLRILLITRYGHPFPEREDSSSPD